MQAVAEQLAVGQTGQGVKVGAFLQCLHLQLALGDIQHHPDIVGNVLLLVVHGGNIQPDGVKPAIAVAVPYLATPLPAGGECLFDLFEKQFVVKVRTEDPWRLAQQFLALEAGELAQCRIDVDDAFRGIGDADGDAVVIE